MRFLLLTICFCFAIFSMAIGVYAAESSSELFEKAGNMYDSGNFNEALSEYESIMENTSSAEVYYNAACSAIKLGKKGLALAYLQRAYDIKPSEESIRNLRTSFYNLLENDGCILMRPSELPFIGKLSENFLATCLFVSIFLFFLLILCNRFLKKDFFWAYSVTGAFLLISLLCLTVTITRFSGDYVAISSPSAEVRESKSQDSLCFYILKDGSEVKLLSQENGWFRISFETKEGKYFEGWVPEKDAFKI